EDNFIKIIEAPRDSCSGTLYFGHSGNHYVALKKARKSPSGNKKRSDTFDWWDKEEYNPGISVFKGRKYDILEQDIPKE
ncbi:Hypothetical predicted protein, partial [Paramuricea clavata]